MEVSKFFKQIFENRWGNLKNNFIAVWELFFQIDFYFSTKLIELNPNF